MNPDEKALLERTLRLSEDNNKILKRLEKRARWVFIWGFIKVAIITLPLIAGYFLLQPYFDQVLESLVEARELLKGF
jgi:hypothetical protein